MGDGARQLAQLVLKTAGPSTKKTPGKAAQIMAAFMSRRRKVSMKMQGSFLGYRESAREESGSHTGDLPARFLKVRLYCHLFCTWSGVSRRNFVGVRRQALTGEALRSYTRGIPMDPIASESDLVLELGNRGVFAYPRKL